MFEQVSDHTELFSGEEWASIEFRSWDESDSSVLISLLTSWLSDLRDRLATEGDIPTADVIGDLVLRLERELAGVG